MFMPPVVGIAFREMKYRIYLYSDAEGYDSYTEQMRAVSTFKGACDECHK